MIESSDLQVETDLQSPAQPVAPNGGASEFRQYVLQILTKETESIASAIIDRNRQSTQIKQWCLTLWMAAWGLVTVNFLLELFKEQPCLLLIAPMVFPPFFLGLEIINKRVERKFTYRARMISRFMNGDTASGGLGGSSLRTFLDNGDLGNFLVYDPAGVNWLNNSQSGPVGDCTKEDMRHWISFWGVVHGSWGLMMFYSILFLLPLLAIGALKSLGLC